MTHEKLVIINIYLKGVSNFLGDAKFFFEVYIYMSREFGLFSNA